MAENRPITTPSEALLREMKDLLRRDRARNDRSRRKRIPQPGKDRSRETGGGDSGTDCGCCNPTHCLTLPDGFDSPFAPVSYKFTVPGALDCNCEDPPGGEITVRKVSEGVYESDSVQCYGPTATTVPCTTTAHWIWEDEGIPPSSCEGNTGNSIYNFLPMPSSPEDDGAALIEFVSDDCGACPDGRVQCSGDPFNFVESYKIANGGLAPRGTFSIPCTSGACEGSTGNWTLVSVDNPDCSGTPEPPDFDGTEDGQEAETEFEGTTSASGDDELQDSFWRLTIGELGAYCQNTTKLDFVVGETVVLTYALARPCKPFCPLCENKFELNQCGPFDCQNISAVVCVAPTAGFIDEDYWSVVCLCDPVVPLAEMYLVTIPEPTPTENDCFAYSMGGGFYCFACDEIHGTYQVHFDAEVTAAEPGAAAIWTSDVIPFAGATAPAAFGWRIRFAAICPEEGALPYAFWILISIVNESGTSLSGWQPQFKYAGDLPPQDCNGTITMPGAIGTPDLQGCYFQSTSSATAAPFLFNT